MDSPYYIEAKRTIRHETEYHILTSAEGVICTVYTLANARLIVDILNRFAIDPPARLA